ncbi:calcium-binding protein [Rhizobium sp. Root274]|uniref:EF-hand domain-containing protein n=1 Tax=unclassified Rhizobium TaxID=2613769 RepID=UPI000714685C|nr:MULTISPECIES: EF-hand domain-containing protein [unclassified Rhizobium]KQW31893.1 calcium-binding protein [Rhizobium sp. Root1240]KRD33432.1 calcium-binding protein [Rhizobium sp. Root274]
MNGRTITLATLAASLLIGTTAGGAFAQDRGDRRGPPRGGPEVMFVRMLQQFDTNKDGKISKEEAAGASEAMFASIDADKDGSITPGEMRKHRESMRAEMEKARAEMKADAPAPDDEAAVPPPPPGDDDQDEAAAPPPDEGPQDMAEADDMGGPDEMRGPDGMDAMGGPGPGKHHDGKGRDGKGHDGKRHGWHNERAERGEGRGDRGPGGMGGPVRMMRVADTDENGQISKAEATAMGDKMFERMDRNKDGVISVDDMPKRPIFFR